MSLLAPSEAEELIITRERLRLLTYGFYVKGAVGVLFISFLLIHFALFLGMSFIPESSWDSKPSSRRTVESASISPSPTPRPVSQQPPAIMFRIFAGVIGIIILAGWTFGALTIYAGRCLRNRQHRVFIYIMAALNCALLPWGTLLGIATFMLLQTPVARREFGPPCVGSPLLRG
jgi:hypothetical protein